MYSSFSRRVKHIVVYDIFRIFLIVVNRIDSFGFDHHQNKTYESSNRPQPSANFQFVSIIRIDSYTFVHANAYDPI